MCLRPLKAEVRTTRSQEDGSGRTRRTANEILHRYQGACILVRVALTCLTIVPEGHVQGDQTTPVPRELSTKTRFAVVLILNNGVSAQFSKARILL